MRHSDKKLSFPEKLRAEIKRAGFTIHEAAEYLDISTNTLESWLAKSSTYKRTPHILTQRGAIVTLQRRTSNSQISRLRKSKYRQGKWRLTSPTGEKFQPLSLKKFCVDNGLNTQSVYSAHRVKREYMGWKISKMEWSSE